MNSNHQSSFEPTTPPRGLLSLQVQERFKVLETMLGDLKSSMAAMKPAQAPPIQAPPQPRAMSRAAAVQVAALLLRERGVITMADLRRELGVSVKTAHRVARSVAHEGGGHLCFEAVGPSERLVLYHPDRVVIDDPRIK
jgi:hypothetical protein